MTKLHHFCHGKIYFIFLPQHTFNDMANFSFFSWQIYCKEHGNFNLNMMANLHFPEHDKFLLCSMVNIFVFPWQFLIYFPWQNLIHFLPWKNLLHFCHGKNTSIHMANFSLTCHVKISCFFTFVY